MKKFIWSILCLLGITVQLLAAPDKATLAALTHEHAPVNINNNYNNITISHLWSIDHSSFAFAFREYTQDLLQKARGSYRYFIIGALGVSYLSVLACVLRGRYVLEDRTAWHAWRSELSLADLLVIAHKDLFNQLRLAMQELYGTPNSSVIMNLVDFFTQTSAEITALRRYLTLGNALERVWLNKAFFVSTDSVKRADEKVKKLLHFRTVIANELEPDNVLARLKLINCSSLRTGGEALLKSVPHPVQSDLR